MESCSSGQSTGTCGQCWRRPFDMAQGKPFDIAQGKRRRAGGAGPPSPKYYGGQEAGCRSGGPSLYAFRLILAPWGGSGAGDWLRHAVRRCLSPVLSRTAGTGTFAARSMPLRSQSPSPRPWLIAVALAGSETDCQKICAHRDDFRSPEIRGPPPLSGP